ncbi:hypothetical protein ACOMHN_019303 [Nucella lapillus]
MLYDWRNISGGGYSAGLDAAGKTTLLYRLKLGEIVTTIPTIEFNVETLDVNGISMVTWDVGLRDKSRPMIRYYLDSMDSVIFMVDSTDRDRLTDAIDDFFSYVNETVQMKQLPVLVLANKQDNSKVLSPEEIKNAIYEKGGQVFRKNTALEVFPTVALTLEGVTPALEWLTSQLALKKGYEIYSPLTTLWSKATHFPAYAVKSAYSTVFGLFSAADSEKKNMNEAALAGK